MKVLILGITNLSNMGDNLIAETTEFLTQLDHPQCTLLHKDLFLRWKERHGFSRYWCLLLTTLRVMAEKRKLYGLAATCFSLQHANYYRKLLGAVDCAIVTSGMLKYNSQGHAYMYSTICRVAEKMGKPLLLNAKSIQRGNKNDPRHGKLADAIHRKGIFINTRDGEEGVEILEKDYNLKGSHFVGDPALWARELYGPAPPRKTGTPIVGLNLIRTDIARDYGQGVQPEKVVALYKGIITELSKRGYNCKLFCNGMHEDFGLSEHLTSNPGDCIPPPTSAREFIQTITSFDVVIGFRLHACIAAVAYDVPVVGMIWDDKSRLFAKSMGIDRYFAAPDNWDATHVADLVGKRLEEPLDYAHKNDLKDRCRNEISRFLKTSCTNGHATGNLQR